MSYRHILRIAIFVNVVVFLTSVLSQGTNNLINYTTVSLVIVLAVVLIIIVSLEDGSLPQVILFVTLTWLYFLIPLVAYSALPDRFPFGGIGGGVGGFGFQQVNAALLFVIIGALVAVLGFHSGSRIAIGRGSGLVKELPASFFSPPRYWLILYLGSFIFEAVTTVLLNRNSRFIGIGEATWWLRFVSIDIVSYLMLIFAFQYWHFFKKRDKAFIVGSMILFILFRAVSGSRAVFYSIGLVTLEYYLAAHKAIRFSRKMLVWSLIAVILSVVIYVPVTMLRGYWDSGVHEIRDLLGHAISESFMDSREVESRDLIEMITRRLDGIDSLLVIMGGSREAGAYLNPVYDLKNIVNGLLPDRFDPFPDAEKTTSELFIVLYRGYPWRYIDTQRVTSIYTMWGVAYAHFGLIGGLVSIFIVTLILSAVYELIRNIYSRYNIYWRVYWLAVVSRCVLSFGYDFDVTELIYFLIPGVIILATLSWMSTKGRKLRQYDGIRQRELLLNLVKR